MCCGQDGQYQSAKEVQAAMELYHRTGNFTLKFIYSEKATKFCKIYTVDLSYIVTVEISQNFVAFSERMNFNTLLHLGYFSAYQIIKS